MINMLSICIVVFICTVMGAVASWIDHKIWSDANNIPESIEQLEQRMDVIEKQLDL